MIGGGKMSDWKNIKIDGIARIEKCVGEFQIWELRKTPYGKFKVKIFERIDGSFAGFTNIRLKSIEDGSPESGVGFGISISEALEDTLNNFMEMLNQRKELSEDDFEWSHPDDF
ncbi:hypothetical protein HMPREF0083_01274 [Aneurinibacillus aneurinilyticus ATCC 12856]|uniref:Uncharacterized protein n=2 Tax=Aneurinibacillus aneurinilyticus TaxID=1391 RepID=U1WPT7_ANEAE|nr:hypothetical protein HMPREF0083_01274 [Aneurinibacillus aneurinilyticus ATCC 12856]